MIYITGDTHGGSDVKKLVSRKVTDRLTKDDTLIICGDFGFIWDSKKEARKEKTWLDWFADMPWTTLFADGNHECFPRLFTYPEKTWNGGQVHEIRPNLFHAMRGQIFTIEGERFFVFGGASSHDRGPAVGNTKAVIGKYWWPEELPSEEELKTAEDNLNACDRKVDYIITHCLPTEAQDMVKHGTFSSDILTDFLQNIQNTVEYKHWYCGHYHRDLDLPQNRTSILFKKVIPAGGDIVTSEALPGSAIYCRKDEVQFMKDGEIFTGIVKAIYPWGMLNIKDEPVYDIDVFPDGNTERFVRETSIIRILKTGE